MLWVLIGMVQISIPSKVSKVKYVFFCHFSVEIFCGSGIVMEKPNYGDGEGSTVPENVGIIPS